MRDQAEHSDDDRADRADRAGRADRLGSARDRRTADTPADAAVRAVAARAAGAGSTLSPAMALALQRTIGNAAVARLLEQQRHHHQHDESCGDQAPASVSAPPTVQRSTVSDVLRSPGRALAGPVRTEMEARLGADFGSVRLHDDPAAARSATEIGARAYTSGNHVVIGAGGADKHTLAHELTHVIQQRRGPVAGTDSGGGLRLSDPSDAFERAAEANASRVMSRAAPASTPAAPAVDPAPEVGTAPAVQRTLIVANRDYSDEYATATAGLSDDEKRGTVDLMVGELWEQMILDADLTPDEWKDYSSQGSRIAHQLRRAIVSPVGFSGHHPVLNEDVGTTSAFGAKNHDIRVNDVTELARGLMGWVYAKQRRKAEKDIAREIQDGSKIEYFLNSLLMRICAKTEGLRSKFTARQFEVLKEELSTGISHLESQPVIRAKSGIPVFDPVTKKLVHDPAKAGKQVGTYLGHFKPSNPKFAPDAPLAALATTVPANGGMLAVLKNPENFGFRDKMMVLHDLMEYFGRIYYSPPTMGTGQTPELVAEDTVSTAEVDNKGLRRLGVEDRGQNPVLKPDGSVKVHPSTRNENSATTILAREHSIPVWAGQSYTAARMFKLAQSSNATKQEIAAVAWGIFSFWRLHYDHTTEFAYHTLHEVMDIAQNFGVDYSLNSPYAGREIFEPGGILYEVKKLQAQAVALSDGLLALDSLASARQGMPAGFGEAVAQIRSPLKKLHIELGALLEDDRCRMDEWAADDKRRNSEFLSVVLDALRRVSGELSGLDTKWQDLKKMVPAEMAESAAAARPVAASAQSAARSAKAAKP
ncbi:DUF4157 domain-containing protein [Streptomyces graminilatus]|uniref:eCIS core domain-containing protein n=1 Tax=Streptomyces graminilatus TaxID=1464070 RepID=UPI0006E1275D